VSRQALGPTQPPIQWVLGVEQPRREADHSLTSSTENNVWSSWRGAQLKKKHHRDKFTFYNLSDMDSHYI